MRKIVALFVVIAMGVLFFLAHFDRSQPSEAHTRMEYNTGRIVSIVEDLTFFVDDGDPFFYGDVAGTRMGTIRFEVEMLRGAFAGRFLEANYHMSSPAHVDFTVGDRVSVRIFEFEGAIQGVEIRHPERSGGVILVVGLFLLFLCLIGGKRGVLGVVGLIFSVASIWFILIPLVARGFPVILMTLIIITLITVATLTLLGGTSRKTVAAILGTLSGMVLATGLALMAGHLLHLNGYHMSHIPQISHLAAGADVRGLFIASVLIASIGAVMDTSISVASGMEEIKNHHRDIQTYELFKSGFNIGRDLMATMSNTLILAFVGGSLSLLLFMYVTDTSFNQFINNDFIAMEIIKGVVGSIGIILTVPLTTFIAAQLLSRD